MSSENLKRRIHSAEFKAKVCLELVRGDYSLSEASAKYSIKDTVLSRWKKEFIERSALVFGAEFGEQENRLRAAEDQLEEHRIEIAVLKRALSLLDDGRGSNS